MNGTWGKGAWMLAAGGLAAFLCGCRLFGPEEASFKTNRDMLDGFAGSAGYEVAADLHRLVGVEIHEDALTFQYRGVAYVGDSAWVVRFSAKSSEQSPEALADVVRVFAVIGETREGFEFVDEGKGTVGDESASYMRYRFRSPVRDNQSSPFLAHGIIATLTREEDGDLVVYHFKLDNHGDRDAVEWADLQPFLDPLRDLK